MIDLLNESGRQWAAWFIPGVIQNTVFLALVFWALHALRRTRAAVRYAVATVGLVKLLIPPFLPVDLLSPLLGRLAPTQPAGLLFSFAQLGEVPMAPATRSLADLDAFGIALVLWGATALIYLLRSATATLRLAGALRGAVAVQGDPDLAEARRRGIGVYCSPRTGMPLTLGLFPRRIFVPEAWRAWDPACKQAVLRHETAHLDRRDGLVQALQIVVGALYFFHPLVGLLNRRLGEYREMACDDASTAGDHHARLAYSRLLVDLAESAIGTPVVCHTASALLRRRHELLKRVSYQVKEAETMKTSKWKTGLVLVALVALILPLSLAQVGAQTPPPPPEKQAKEKQMQEKQMKEQQLNEQQMKEQQVKEKEMKEQQVKEQKMKEQQVKEKEMKELKVKEQEFKKQEFKERQLKGEGQVPSPPAKIQIRIEERRTLIDGVETAPGNMAGALKRAAGGNSEAAVVKMECVPAAPMSLVHQVQSGMREAGIAKVYYADEKGKGLPLVLPGKDLQAKLAALPEGSVAEVFLADDGTLTIDGKKVKGEKLGQILAARVEEAPHLVVSVRMAANARYADFTNAMLRIKEAGVDKIAVNDPES